MRSEGDRPEEADSQTGHKLEPDTIRPVVPQWRIVEAGKNGSYADELFAPVIRGMEQLILAELKKAKQAK